MNELVFLRIEIKSTRETKQKRNLKNLFWKAKVFLFNSISVEKNDRNVALQLLNKRQLFFCPIVSEFVLLCFSDGEE